MDKIMTKNSCNIRILKIIINVIVSFSFVLLFSSETSPLYQNLCGDQAKFMLIGRGILEGYVPYRDLLENKGPLFFLLLSFPQILKGTLGVYILQSILLTSECFVIDMIALECKFGYKMAQILKLFLFLPLLIVYICGSKAEEYDLFFIMLCFMLFFKSYRSKSKREIYFYAFLYGLFIGAIIFIKMPDAAAPLTMCFISLMYTCRKVENTRRERIFFAFSYIACSAVGLGITTVISCVYYVMHDAFGDMIYGYLMLNFFMVDGSGGLGARLNLLLSIYGLFTILPCIIIFIYAYFCLKEDRNKIFMSFSFLLISISVAIMSYTHATGFRAHLIPSVLIWIMAGICILDRIRLKDRLFKVEIALVSLYVFMYLNAGLNYEPLINTDVIWRQKEHQDTLIDAIPEEDYDSIHCLEIDCNWYYKNHIYPAYRNLNLKGFIATYAGERGKVVAEDFESELINNPVKWLIVPFDLEYYQEILTDETIEFIKNHYEFREIVDDYDEHCDYYIYQLQ